MKKKAIIAAVALMLTMLSATAKSKHYSDRTNGYSGDASATYKGTASAIVLDYYDSETYFILQETMLDAIGAVMTRRLKKLSNAENFLNLEGSWRV